MTKRYSTKKVQSIIADNDPESMIINDTVLTRFDNDYSELELELAELELEKEFKARQRLIAAKKIESAKPVIMVQKKNISNRAARTTDNKTRNYEVIVSGLILGIDKKQMRQDIEKAGWKPITAKSFVNSVACVYKAIKGESRKIDGIVYIATQALLNNEAMPKWGDANSKNYVENVVKAYRVLTAKKTEKVEA